jgi:hypothetical protein
MTRRVGDILEQVREERRTLEREEFSRRFLEVFPDGFKTLPKGFQFRSRDERGFSISVFASPTKTTLWIQVEGEEQTSRGRKKVYNKYQVSREGDIKITDAPQIKELDEVTVLTEVLDRAQEIALLNWRTTSLDLDPQGEADDVPVPGLTPEERSKNPSDIDIDRIELLANHPGVLAQFVNERKGFKGYRLYLLPRGCVLESDAMRNAAYLVRFGTRIEKSRRDLRTMPDKELDELLRAQPGSEFITASKSDKRAEAAKGSGARVRRIVHVGDWKTRIAEAIKEVS